MAAKAAILDPVEWRRIFEAARRISPEHWAVCMILFETGMHVQSLVELKPEWVLPDKLLWRRPKKEAKQPWIQQPMTKILAHALGEFRKYPRKTRFTYFRMVQQVGRAAGRPDLAPMTFRHTRAVRLILQGLPPMYIEAAMGASMSVIKRAYGALTPDQLLEVQRRASRQS